MDSETGDAQDVVLDAEAARVLGALIEKRLATPRYYPLTANALLQACNQKTNREPAMELALSDVRLAFFRLRAMGLAWIAEERSRVLRFEEVACRRLELRPRHAALLALLLLRGPQTAGELRGRAGRMHAFASLGETLSALAELAAHSLGAFVVRLPPVPGTREPRYAHGLQDEPRIEPSARLAIARPAATGDERLRREAAAGSGDERAIAALEAEVRSLSRELTVLAGEIDGFLSQFEE